jgi:hypothetical protein
VKPLEYEYRLTNREKKRAPKSGLFWCDTCDRRLVREWEKCPECGQRSGQKRLKPKKRGSVGENDRGG